MKVSEIANTRTVYVCEDCGREYGYSDLAIECEERHIQEKKDDIKAQEIAGKILKCEHLWEYETSGSYSSGRSNDWGGGVHSLQGINRICSNCGLIENKSFYDIVNLKEIFDLLPIGSNTESRKIKDTYYHLAHKVFRIIYNKQEAEK